MARKNRRSSTNIREDGDTDTKKDLKSDLLKHGATFSFFQVMRLFRLLGRINSRDLKTDPSRNGNIRVRPKLSLTFPPADVDQIEEKEGKNGSLFEITANFLGLYGISSPLPTFYTEDLLNEAADDLSISRDFIDIINNRIYELFYKCLTKYRLPIQVVEERNPQYIQRLFSLVGLGEDKLREDIPESHGLLRYIGLFTQFPRSAMGLKTLLQDALGKIPVDVIPCMKRYVKIPEDQRICIGIYGGILGNDSFLGEEIEDRNGMFRLRVGPMSKINFQESFPGGDKYKKLVLLTKLYMVEPLDYDIELIMEEGRKQTACLGNAEWAHLGVTTWIFSGKDRWESRSIVYPES